MPSGAPRATNGLSAAALRALLAAPDARVAALGAPLATPRPEGAGDPALGHIERLYEEQAQLSPRLKAAAAAAAGRYSGVGGALHAALAEAPRVQRYALERVADAACSLPAPR